MILKNVLRVLFGIAILISFLFVSCEKIDLPEQGSSGDDREEEFPNVDSGDSVNTNGILSVSDVLLLQEANQYDVVGYIVGYIKGNSIKTGARFEIPEDKPNTNFLLADHKGETDYNNCIAVKLSKNYGIRDSLNLYDKPQLLGRKIYIYGWIDTYFGRNGIVSIDQYLLDDSDGNAGDNQNPFLPPQIENDSILIVEGR